jgi:DNA mismatch endonuclease (patch repair protein)
MSLIKSKNTKPELLVRKMLKGLGISYRHHPKKLPGNPDFILPKLDTAVFVHGCYWHRHGATSCKLARLPKSRLDFWLPKLEANRLRDKRNQRRLRALGWRIMVVWECELSHKERTENRLFRLKEAAHGRD